MKKLFRSGSTKSPPLKSTKDDDEDDDEFPNPDPNALRRPSSLQLEPTVSAMKQPSAPNSPPKTRPRQRSVHFSAPETQYLEAQQYSHQQRFTINSGLYLHFEKPPTANYKFLTTAESIQTRGTLRQLITSANTEETGNTWDSVTPLPLYAARYANPRYTREEKSIYWEMKITSLGFSRFSSVDGTGPHTPVNAEEDGIADVGLSRSISHTITQLPGNTGRSTGNKLAMGLVCKCVTPDTVPFLRRKSSLRPIDEFEFPYCVYGSGIFWSSDNGGTVFINGKRTKHAIAAGAGDSVGMGMTFETVPEGTEDCLKPVESITDGKGRKISINHLNSPGLEPEELKTVPTSVFMVVNGQKYTITTSEPSTNPFDISLPKFMCGKNDIYPCICVQGAGVEVKTKMGEAVDWEGPGGKIDSKKFAMGDRDKTAKVNGTAEKDKEKDKDKDVKKKWWHRASISG